MNRTNGIALAVWTWSTKSEFIQHVLWIPGEAVAAFGGVSDQIILKIWSEPLPLVHPSFIGMGTQDICMTSNLLSRIDVFACASHGSLQI